MQGNNDGKNGVAAIALIFTLKEIQLLTMAAEMQKMTLKDWCAAALVQKAYQVKHKPEQKAKAALAAVSAIGRSN
jgi:hypothetical protein